MAISPPVESIDLHPLSCQVDQDSEFRTTHNGRAFRLLTIIDEYSRESLAIKVARRLTSEDVLDQLTQLFIQRRIPDCIRSDNDSEFTSNTVRKWLAALAAQTLFVEPGSRRENGYVESFNGKLREAQVLVERRRRHYHTVKPHSSLGYRPSPPEAVRAWPRRP